MDGNQWPSVTKSVVFDSRWLCLMLPAPSSRLTDWTGAGSHCCGTLAVRQLQQVVGLNQVLRRSSPDHTAFDTFAC